MCNLAKCKQFTFYRRATATAAATATTAAVAHVVNEETRIRYTLCADVEVLNYHAWTNYSGTVCFTKRIKYDKRPNDDGQRGPLDTSAHKTFYAKINFPQ